MRICEDCGFNNEPDRLFCGACGEPIQGEAKLIRDTEKLKEKKEEEAKVAANTQNVVPQGHTTTPVKTVQRRPKKKDNGLDVLLISLAAIAFVILVICIWYLVKYYL